MAMVHREEEEEEEQLRWMRGSSETKIVDQFYPLLDRKQKQLSSKLQCASVRTLLCRMLISVHDEDKEHNIMHNKIQQNSTKVLGSIATIANHYS